MFESVIFHMPGELQASPAIRGSWQRPLLELLIEARATHFVNNAESACAEFVGWCLQQEPCPVWFLNIASLPGLPWDNSDWDAWAWYDDLMAEIARWDPPPLLVDLSDHLITQRKNVLWPKGAQHRVDRRSRREDAPFGMGWFGQDLGDFRPGERTYECYPPEELPPISLLLNGKFDWLEGCSSHERSIAANPAKTEAALAKLLATNPVGLPSDFVNFFRSPSLWKRIRSCTGSYLRLDSSTVEIRGGLGRLVRFMSDSQDCLHWSLYISPDESENGVVATYFFSGSDATDVPEPAHPRDCTLCATSFEEFICRFWLENELWFTIHDKGKMPAHGEEYLAHFQSET